MARPRPLLMAATALTALASGCSTIHDDTVDVPVAQMDNWLADKPDSARHLYASVLTGGERNRVLNQIRAGLAAFEAGADEIAAQSFDDALNRIEAIYADNPQAERARSNFVPERSKAFKGESYERAMAFYYRGLLFLAQGDYGNARAVFQGGQLQDAFAEDQRYQSDFAVLDVLSGWASQCEGNAVLAYEFYTRAALSRPDIYIPRAGDRTLAIADIGLAPEKIGDGEYGEVLSYIEPGSVPESSVVFMAGKTPWSASFGEDIYWQATTRGGRQVDRILAGKAEFKDNAVAVASVSLALADIAFDVAEFQTWDDHYEDDTDADEALAWGLGLAVLGIGAALTAEATVPEADTRYWDNLPAHIDFITLPAGAMPTEVIFTDDYGTALGSQPARIRTDPKGRCSLVYARSRLASDVPTTPPNSRLGG